MSWWNRGTIPEYQTVHIPQMGELFHLRVMGINGGYAEAYHLYLGSNYWLVSRSACVKVQGHCHTEFVIQGLKTGWAKIVL